MESLNDLLWDVDEDDKNICSTSSVLIGFCIRLSCTYDNLHPIGINDLCAVAFPIARQC